MALTPTLIYSTDPGTPTMTGQVGNGYQVAKHCLLASGWTLEYEYVSGQRGVFRNNPITGTGYYLEIDDTGTSAAGARAMVVYAWESYNPATQVGTNRVPTAVQLAAGKVIWKSNTADGTARAWNSLGTERDLFIFVDVNSVGGGNAVVYGAFDLRSIRPTDQHCFVVAAAQSTTLNLSANMSVCLRPGAAITSVVSSSADQGAYIGRANSMSVGAAVVNFSRDITGASGSNEVYGGAGTPHPYPHEVTNGLMFERALVHEAAYRERGYVPGVYIPLHARPFSHGHIESSVDGLPTGTQLLALNYRLRPGVNAGGTNGQLLFDITNEW